MNNNKQTIDQSLENISNITNKSKISLYVNLIKNCSDKCNMNEVFDNLLNYLITNKIKYSSIKSDKIFYDMLYYFKYNPGTKLKEYFNLLEEEEKCKMLTFEDIYNREYFLEEFDNKTIGNQKLSCLLYKENSLFYYIVGNPYGINEENNKQFIETANYLLKNYSYVFKYVDLARLTNNIYTFDLFKNIPDDVFNLFLKLLELRLNYKLSKSEKQALFILRNLCYQEYRKVKINNLINKYISKKDIIKFEI